MLCSMPFFLVILFSLDLSDYTVKMYSNLAIRLRTNKRVDEYREGDTAQIGILHLDGEYSFYPWAGFIDIQKARRIGEMVRLKVDSYCVDDIWTSCDHLLGCVEYVGDSLKYRVHIIVPITPKLGLLY